MVYVDHQRIGTTPVSTNYVYYGTREFEIIKDGFKTEKFMRRFNPPWYEFPGLDSYRKLYGLTKSEMNELLMSKCRLM